MAGGDGLGVEDLPSPGSHTPCAAFRHRRGQPGGRRSGERGAAAQHGCPSNWTIRGMAFDGRWTDQIEGLAFDFCMTLLGYYYESQAHFRHGFISLVAAATARFPQPAIIIRRSIISLVAAATARFPQPASSAALTSPSAAFLQPTTSSFSPSRQSLHFNYRHSSTIMGGRLTRSGAQKEDIGHDADTAIVVPAAAVNPRRKSPRFSTSVMSLSTSSGSDDIKASSSSASKSTVRKTRGRPRRKAAEISLDDTETASASTNTDGRKKRRSTRVKKA